MQKDPARLPPLDLLASFEAAARHLSFTRAGAERFITQSAMSRQMRALEDELGVALFRRQHRALALTADGERLQAACVAVLAQLRDVLVQIRSPARREVLALSTTPGLAALWLIPRLPQLTKLHPGVDVRLDTSLDVRNLRADGFDMAIRYGRVGATPGTPLFSEAMQPVCSPLLLKRGSGAPPLRTPHDLRLHTLLQVEAMQRAGVPLEWDLWLQGAGLVDLQPASTLSFSGYDAAIAAALAGQGVALGRRPLVDALLKSRRLVAPFKGATASMRAYFLIVEPAARAKPALRALETWLLEQAALEG